MYKRQIPKKEGVYPRVSSKPDLQKMVINHSGKGKDAQSYINYMVIHASTYAGATLDPAKIEQDERNGVYHFGIGMDRGIVKDINFKANKTKFGTEMRIIDGGQRNIAQLYEKYDADISMWGNPMFRNGQYLYIDPKSMGVSAKLANTLGLGGYYMIVKVRGELGRDGYNVDLTCKYQNNGLCRDQGTPQIDNSAQAAATSQTGVSSDQTNNGAVPDHDIQPSGPSSDNQVPGSSNPPPIPSTTTPIDAIPARTNLPSTATPTV